MESIIPWIKAARLRTLPLALSCVVISAFIAIKANSFGWNIFVLAVLTTILLQVLANFANDYGDAQNGADNENRVGPDRMVQSGLITQAQMKTGIITTIILTLISGISLLVVAFGELLYSSHVILLFVLGVISIIAALKYTAGVDPYGYKAMGDLSVFLFFGILGVLGNIYLYTHEIEWINVLPAISIGALSMAVLNLNNMRDRIEDAKVGKRTIPVIIGQKSAKTYHFGLFFLALVCALAYSFCTTQKAVHLIYIIPFVVLLIHLIKVSKSNLPDDFDPELKKVALSTFVFALLFGIGLIL